VELELVCVNSDKEEMILESKLKGVDGIVVPIGWGTRGVKGKLKAIQYARENKVPFLGLCYGMQLACVEFARNVVGLKDADTEEINPKAKDLIIHSIPFNEQYQVIKGDGCSMRLGTFDCLLKKGSLVYDVYAKYGGLRKYLRCSEFISESKKVLKQVPARGGVCQDDDSGIIQERHRHRFEFNNKYIPILEKHGLVFSGMSPDGMFVEVIELPRKVHPFFLATQGHPEYRSRPLNPHPVFVEFLRASLKV